MKGYSDMLALLEWVDRKKPGKEKKIKDKITLKDFIQFQKDLRDYEEWMKTQKKEDKKEEKKGMSIHHISFFLMATFPITAPLYVYYVRAMLH